MMRAVPSSIVFRTRVCKALAGAIVAFWVVGCATERLDTAAPSGVNLTGEWKLNPNLSDDPDKLGPDPDKTPQRAPGSHRGHGGRGGGGGGGIPPIGSPGGSDEGYNHAPTSGAYAAPTGGFLPVALTAPGIEQSAPLPPVGTPTPGAASTSRGVSINRFLKAPLNMSIIQKESNVAVRTNMPDGTQTADEYTAGSKTTVPYGKDDTAERTAGWRGPVFVVTTAVKKGGWREDDFALDDDGRLIMTTQTKGGRLGKVEIKRVYDRIRGAQS